MSIIAPVEAMGRVLVVGSVNVDLVVVADRLPAPGETVVGDDLARYGGGKGANAAVAAARSGAAVRFVGAVGDDEHGRWSRSELDTEGIDTTGVAVVGRPTGVALIVVSRHGENQIAVASGANAAVDMAMVNSTLDGGHHAGQEFGAVLASAEVPVAALAAVAEWAAGQGVVSVLNPAPMTAAVAALVPSFDVATPNETELGDLADAYGVPPGPISQRAQAVARTAGTTLIVTVGADGSLFVPPDGGVIAVPATPVEAVDTTGAGDTLNGVLAASLAAGLAPLDAARRATVAASLSVAVAGARGGMPSAAAIAAALVGGR